MPRRKGSPDLLADRRRRALVLPKSGLSLNEVARRIPCVASSVMRWRNAWRRRGADALKVRSSPGRPVPGSFADLADTLRAAEPPAMKSRRFILRTSRILTHGMPSMSIVRFRSRGSRAKACVGSIEVRPLTQAGAGICRSNPAVCRINLTWPFVLSKTTYFSGVSWSL